jgi:predicted RNase H-like HicB family nuclease
MTTRRTFTARFTLDPERVWLVELAEEPRVHTYGRTLVKARAHIRDATALWFELDPDSFDLVEDVRLPKPVANAVGKANQARERARRVQAEAGDLATQAAVALVRDLKVGVRDAAELLGVSHSRVQQLVETPREREVAGFTRQAPGGERILKTAPTRKGVPARQDRP